MESQQLQETILKELPALIQHNKAFRQAVIKITRHQFADKVETESRFDRMMNELIKHRQFLEQQLAENHQKWEANQQELKMLREEQQRKWEENQRKWEENEHQWKKNWEELRLLREEQQRKWEAQERKWEENQRKWEANERKWEKNQEDLRLLREAQERKWEDGQRQLTTAIQKLDRKFDQTLGAIGTRWGLHSEESFRNALAGILKEFPGVEVTRLLDYDDTGVVFGYPDQVDLDLIVKNGLLIVAELKSSFSKSEMYIFEKKVRFYEHKYTKQVNRMMVISPMVEENAKPVAAKLGIEIYSSAENVKL